MTRLASSQSAVLPELLELGFQSFVEQYYRWTSHSIELNESTLRGIFEENIRGFFRSSEDFVRNYALSEEVLGDLYGGIPIECIDYERVTDRMFDLQNGEYIALTIELKPLFFDASYRSALELLYPGRSNLTAVLSADPIRVALQYAPEAPRAA